MSIVTQAPGITLTPVTSSQIFAIGHCAATNTLAVQFFHNGAPGNAYHYQNFSADDYAAFASAESMGKYFYKHIKPATEKYPCKNMGVPAAEAAPKLTKELLAIALSGCEYGSEITKAEEAVAKAAGLLVIFGASDDLMEFRGAVHDERGAPCVALIDARGLLPFREDIQHDDDALKDYFARAPLVRSVDAQWCKEDGYSWTFRTDVPHAPFEIVEDGEPYCRGIVIDLADLAPVAA